jgi:hypothetical protein
MTADARYDAVVVGGGHHGTIIPCNLARARGPQEGVEPKRYGNSKSNNNRASERWTYRSSNIDTDAVGWSCSSPSTRRWGWDCASSFGPYSRRIVSFQAPSLLDEQNAIELKRIC